MEMNAVNRTNQTRVFCGFCRDMVAGASLCFKGDTRPTCPPAIPPADGNAVPCTSDADCLAAGDSYESCIQRDPGAFSYAAASRITVTGETDGECMQDGLPHPSTLVSIFCVPPTFDQTVDGVGDLPGPGAALLVGEGQLLP